MKTSNYRDNAMWGRTPRVDMTPAEYACSLECHTAPWKQAARVTGVILVASIVALAVVIAWRVVS